MKFLKKMAIKKVTKKRFNQLMGMIENDLPEDGSPIDPMKTLKKYIETVESLSGEQIEIPGEMKNWWELFLYLTWIMVKSELSYDPTMGSERDLYLTMETADKLLEKWKKESMLKKLVRRDMILSMAIKEE